MSDKKEERINEIIEAAIAEFIEKGYEKTSMDSIAKRANLSKGGLYHHFKSKTEILFSVNLKFIEPVQYFIGEIGTASSLVEGLKAYITNYLYYWINHKRELSLYFLIMNESYNNEEIMALYRESTREVFDYFEMLILKGQEMGVFKERDARSHAIAMISCLDGLLGYVLIDPSISIGKLEAVIHAIFIADLLI
jgi:AcrR family transcriptional regulator